MVFTRDSIPDLTGRTAVVTGANGGLGLETTKALAAKGAHVVMAARNLAKATEAAEQIRAETPNASLEVVPLDLGLLGSVREAAERMLAHPGLANTDLQSTTVEEGGGGFFGPFFHTLAARTGMSPAQGALPQIRAATDPAAKGGELYAPRFVNNGAPVRWPILRPGTDRAIATLWQVSERETGIALKII